MNGTEIIPFYHPNVNGFFYFSPIIVRFFTCLEKINHAKIFKLEFDGTIQTERRAGQLGKAGGVGTDLILLLAGGNNDNNIFFHYNFSAFRNIVGREPSREIRLSIRRETFDNPWG